MFKIADRVKEITLTEGNGLQIQLQDTFSGFQSFSDGIGNGNSTYYTIENGANFEIGIGTYTASNNSLSRDEILDSTNNNQRISLVGLSVVFCTYPASKVFLLNSQGFATAPDGTYAGIVLPDGTIVTSNIRHFRTITSNSSISALDDIVLVNCNTNNVVATLPLASDMNGKSLTFKMVSSTGNYYANIVSQGGNLIDSNPNIEMRYKNTSLTLVSNSNNWYII
jgi:hypothetical protein